MKTSRTWLSRSLLVVAVSLAASPVVLGGCQGGADQVDESIGTVSIPLIAVSTAGTEYRLRQANFTIGGTAWMNVSSENSLDEPAILLDLDPGGYTIRLENGWQLERMSDGQWVVVDALLTSPESQGFTVAGGEETIVRFEFITNGEDVILGPGTTRIEIAVTEVGGTGDGSGETQSAGCGTAPTLMNGQLNIQSSGTNREYILRMPDDYDSNTPYRLVLAYHGLNSTASQVANGGAGSGDFYGLWDLSEGNTIFVAPEGLDGGWANTNGRDVTLTDDILEELLGDLCIDTGRIFATGFNYGAGMSYALACSRADVFRGVALYSGAQLSGCQGGNTPTAFFQVHGVLDAVLDISQARQLRDNFANVNGCTPQSPPEPSANSGSHVCTSYEGCTDGYPVRWCAHAGGHIPLATDQGQSQSWVPGETWDFISQF